MATMPPAAPARAWMTESLAMSVVWYICSRAVKRQKRGWVKQRISTKGELYVLVVVAGETFEHLQDPGSMSYHMRGTSGNSI